MAELDSAPSTSCAPTPPRPSASNSPAPPPHPAPKEPATDGMHTDDLSPAPQAPSPAPLEDPATAGMSSSTTARRPASASPPRETDEQRADKKRKLEAVQKESRQRGARMFGVMMGTLQRAKREVKQVEQTDAGRKRAELQGRLREKLDAERREAMDKAQRDREAKDLKVEILRREEELAHADSIFRTRQSAKLTSARFLCTTFTPPPPPPSSSDLLPPLSNPRLPHALKVSDPRAPRPIYYLPYRLLPSQEDRLDDQLDAVRKARDAEQEAFDAARRDKVRELDDARRRKAERDDEIERAERDERQKRRREAEEREEKERKAAEEARKARAGGEKADGRSASPPRPAAAADSERMDEDVEGGGSAPTSLRVNGAAGRKEEGAQDEVKAPASGEDVAMDGQEPAAGKDGDATAGGAAEPAVEGMNGGAAAAGAEDEAAPAEAAPAAAVSAPDDELEY
ncbi:hypothetical protein JCM9279_005568 [Rhodotorula babjevae]